MFFAPKIRDLNKQEEQCNGGGFNGASRPPNSFHFLHFPYVPTLIRAEVDELFTNRWKVKIP